MLGSNRQSNNELIILKVKTADAEKKPVPVHFEVMKKVDGKWAATGETRDVSGRVTKVETYEREWEGKMTPLVKLYIEDESVQETYLLDLRYNMLSRNLFNNILSLTSFEEVSIALRDKKKGDKTYPTVYVNQGGKKVDWKYKVEELPKVVKVMVGKTEHTSFDDLNDFFIKELTELSEVVKSQMSQRTATAPKVDKVEDAAPEGEEGDSDIPF